MKDEANGYDMPNGSLHPLLEAAQKAISNANFDPKNIGALIISTNTPYQPLPSTACILQDKLGITNVMACDIMGGGNGFISGFLSIESMISYGNYDSILYISTDLPKIFLESEADAQIGKFSDGASAFLFQASDTNSDSKVLWWKTGSVDSQGIEPLQAPAGFTRHTPTPLTVMLGMHKLRCDTDSLKILGTQSLANALEIYLRENKNRIPQAVLLSGFSNMKKSEIAAQIGMPEEKIFSILDDLGNFLSASLGIGLANLLNTGKLKIGDELLLLSYGFDSRWSAIDVII